MTKQDVLEFYQNMNQLGELKGVRFSYGIAKNLNILKPEIEALQKALEPTKEYQEFDVKRIELVKKYAKLDDKGEPITSRNEYILDDEKAFNKAFEVLKKENKELVDKRDKQIDEYQELLKTESTIELYKIKLADIPEIISAQQMYGISLIVEE